MTDTSQDIKEKRKAITEKLGRELHKLPLDIEVWLYGSEARGDARPDSESRMTPFRDNVQTDRVRL